MDINDAKGPGVGSWLIDRLKTWGIQVFTDIQIRAIHAGVADGQSLIISAPTSSGKTLISEIALLSALKNGRRIIYLVSHKALADQKYADFNSKLGEVAGEPIASIGLSTGDRAEGALNAQVIVSTYEKAMGLIVTGQLNPTNALIVADELQILGEKGRGPEIEAFCAVLRTKGFNQLIALTATVHNPEDLAGWMNCELVSSSVRDVPLHQEIWFENQIHRTTFGNEEGEDVPIDEELPSDIKNVVSRLLTLERDPILVFTETKREAVNYASQFIENRPRVGEGVGIAERLDLFSEPTESSGRLKEVTERG